MKTLARLSAVVSLATLVAAFANGCSAAADDAGEASAEVAAGGSNTELVRYLTKAQRDDVHREWIRRNGSEWNTTIAGESVVESLTPTIRGIQRKDAVGPDAHLTTSQVLSTAQAMMTKNADLLGIPADQVARLEAKVFPPNASNRSFTVGFEASFSQPGYERFPELENHASVFMHVNVDGVVRMVGTYGSQWAPKLTLDTRPGLEKNDPAVIAKVVGTPAAFYENTGTILFEPYYVPCMKHVKHDLGGIAAGDVDGVELMVHETEAEGGHRFTLAYRVHARKDAHPFVFVVDAGSGNVLEQPVQYAAAADGTLWLYTQHGAGGGVSPLGICY